MGSMVSFEPGARTAWHTHPLGQTLIVISGCGWVQSEGGKKKDPAGRRDLDARQHPALAWSPAKCGDGALRHGRTAEWQQRGVDGEGHRRAIRPAGASTCMTWTTTEPPRIVAARRRGRRGGQRAALQRGRAGASGTAAPVIVEGDASRSTANHTRSSSTRAPRCSMRCAITCISPAPRRAAITASAAPAR